MNLCSFCFSYPQTVSTTTTATDLLATSVPLWKFPTIPTVHVKSKPVSTKLTTQTITTTAETPVLTYIKAENSNSHQTLRSQPQHFSPRTTIKSSPSATNSTTPMKSHKTDAPMLNYIFDSHLATNKHHHRDR